jgi:hypothetical protein
MLFEVLQHLEALIHDSIENGRLALTIRLIYLYPLGLEYGVHHCSVLLNHGNMKSAALLVIHINRLESLILLMIKGIASYIDGKYAFDFIDLPGPHSLDEVCGTCELCHI